MNEQTSSNWSSAAVSANWSRQHSRKAECESSSLNGTATKLGVPASTLDSKIMNLYILKSHFQLG